jgi:hypothetical protein
MLYYKITRGDAMIRKKIKKYIYEYSIESSGVFIGISYKLYREKIEMENDYSLEFNLFDSIHQKKNEITKKNNK